MTHSRQSRQNRCDSSPASGPDSSPAGRCANRPVAALAAGGENSAGVGPATVGVVGGAAAAALCPGPVPVPDGPRVAGRPFWLGLTGGIGSGKSTVAKLLAQQGRTPQDVAVVDADAVSRALTASGGAAIVEIARAFGPQMITPEGALDRAAMRAHVFAHAQQRQRLQDILHPLVKTHMLEQARAAACAGARLVVFDIPLLAESAQAADGGHWLPVLDAVLVVDCAESTQIRRVMQRSALTPEAVQAIMAAQATRAQRRALATWLLTNEGDSLAALHGPVRALWGQLPL